MHIFDKNNFFFHASTIDQFLSSEDFDLQSQRSCLCNRFCLGILSGTVYKNNLNFKVRTIFLLFVVWILTFQSRRTKGQNSICIGPCVQKQLWFWSWKYFPRKYNWSILFTRSLWAWISEFNSQIWIFAHNLL